MADRNDVNKVMGQCLETARTVKQGELTDKDKEYWRKKCERAAQKADDLARSKH